MVSSTLQDKLRMCKNFLKDAYNTIVSKGGTLPVEQDMVHLNGAIESIPSVPAPSACYIYIKTDAPTTATIYHGGAAETWNLETGDNYLQDNNRTITSITASGSNILEIDLSHSAVVSFDNLSISSLTKLTLGDSIISNGGRQTLMYTKISNILYLGKSFSWWLGYQVFYNGTTPDLHFAGDIVPQFQYPESGQWTDINPPHVYVGHGDSKEEDDAILTNLVTNSSTFARWNALGKLTTWYSHINS